MLFFFLVWSKQAILAGVNNLCFIAKTDTKVYPDKNPDFYIKVLYAMLNLEI